MALFGSLLSWYFRRRMQQVEYAMHNAAEIQARTLKNLIDSAQNTVWGKKYDYKNIKTPEQFAKKVPVSSYEELKPFIERNMKGEQNVLWPSEIKWFAKSSGTTNDKSKFIPVSYEALEDCHFQGGRDLLTIYCHNHPETKIFDGKGLVLGGSHKINSYNANSSFGDLSAVMMANLPFWVNFLRTPDISIALLDEWEEKLERMANATVNEDVTNISGVPTWTVVLINHLFEMTGKKSLLEIWPNLELYVHGGVSFVPYREQFNKLIPSSGMNYMETYNASEGFFGLQIDSARDDMLLLADYGVYYEFAKLEDLHSSDYPKTYRLDEVEEGVNYAMIISTNAGLWRYVVGDTVKFTSTNPYTFKITGRTKLYINAFGEELMIDNAEAAMAAACKETDAVIRDFTAAPIYFDDAEGKSAGHEWLIEFEKPPTDPAGFNMALDAKLKALNSDYEAKRHKDIALKPPRVHVMPDGSFHKWLKNKGKLGGQHKVPRLSNNRTIVDEILQQQSVEA
jgi:hypothetical protein